jgi:hypothetical protein
MLDLADGSIGGCSTIRALRNFHRRRIGHVSRHPHRFRDTFAVSLLLKGVSIEIVSAAQPQLDQVTERHYAPWVRRDKSNSNPSPQDLVTV